MDKKACKTVLFQAELFFSPVETCDGVQINVPGCCGDLEPICFDVCNPRNWRVRVTDGPKQETIVGLHLIHVLTTDDYPVGCLNWRLYRNTDCGGCCAPEMYEMPVQWHGNGMMLPSGEYVLDLPEQISPPIEGGFPTDKEEVIDFPIEIILEPVGQEFLQAAQYNAAASGCDCLGVIK